MHQSCGPGIAFIEEGEFHVEIVSGRHHAWRSDLLKNDCVRTASLAHRAGIRHVIVDHYGARSRYLAELHRQGLNVGVIDDLADRDLKLVGWLLNQNLGASEQTYLTKPDCRMLLGSRYALLRSEFSRRAVRRRLPLQADKRVLVTLGGGDNTRLAEQVLAALGGVKRRLDVRCVLGTIAEPPRSLLEAARNLSHTVRLLGKVKNMAKQMAWADLSINAGGSTCWELCYLGVPMIVLVLSRDQAPVAEALVDKGCAYRVGDDWAERQTGFMLSSLVEKLLNDPQERAKMSARAQRLVDGRGAARAANALLKWAQE